MTEFLSCAPAQVRRYRTRPANEPVVWRAETIQIFVLTVKDTDLLQSRSIPDLLDVVRVMGGDNVFISVYESGIWDDGKGALMEPDLVLTNYGAERGLEPSTTTRLDEMTVLDDAPRCVLRRVQVAGPFLLALLDTVGRIATSVLLVP